MISEQRRAQILAAARRLLDKEGVEAITMRRLGALVGIRGPSLYKHFSSRDQIHTALEIEALTDLTDILEPVPRTFTDLAAADRAWAVEHRHLFQLLNRQPLPRARLPPGLEERTAAFPVDACHGDVDLVRAARATTNGLIDLGTAGVLIGAHAADELGVTTSSTIRLRQFPTIREMTVILFCRRVRGRATLRWCSVVSGEPRRRVTATMVRAICGGTE